ncbi:MAG: putative molybdenum carrier protein [Gemmataceae bacterium]|nr:putative molybdenum carrier protein [Gemmataceae bacterium]MCI0741410.1 putative molybdenum carrier protein [Gemmataceae bacterium]
MGNAKSNIATDFPRSIKIISGGQTGVDRAALDAALELGLECGGFCPKGRRAENGPIPKRYKLEETATEHYPERTKANVLAADATLILTRDKPDGGTALTLRLAKKHKKPVKTVNLMRPLPPQAVRRWIADKGVSILNIAGPRESTQRGIHNQALKFLKLVLTSLTRAPGGCHHDQQIAAS